MFPERKILKIDRRSMEKQDYKNANHVHTYLKTVVYIYIYIYTCVVIKEGTIISLTYWERILPLLSS